MRRIERGHHLHDISDLEIQGIVGVFVASSAFVEAARAQSDARGFAPAAVFVPHPIQDRTDAELHTLADAAFEAILDAVCQEQA